MLSTVMLMSLGSLGELTELMKACRKPTIVTGLLTPVTNVTDAESKIGMVTMELLVVTN
jgi:hypothetical protein